MTFEISKNSSNNKRKNPLNNGGKENKTLGH